MAFLTSQRGAGTPNVALGFSNADRAAVAIKNIAVIVRDKAQAGTVTASDILDGLLQTLVIGKATLMAASGTPGIGAYASEQYADVPGYNVATEFTAMMDEINTTITFLVQNYPKDADGNLKKLSFNADNSGNLVSFSAFTAPQRTAVSNRMIALLATID
jgi:hypothetical protein